MIKYKKTDSFILIKFRGKKCKHFISLKVFR